MESKYKIQYDIGSQGEFLFNLMEYSPRVGHKMSGWRMIKSYKDEVEANKTLKHLQKNEVAE